MGGSSLSVPLWSRQFCVFDQNLGFHLAWRGQRDLQNGWQSANVTHNGKKKVKVFPPHFLGLTGQNIGVIEVNYGAENLFAQPADPRFRHQIGPLKVKNFAA